MRTLFILLLSCLPCFAQFGVEQPIFASRSTQSPFPTGDLWSWWRSESLVGTNGQQIGVWSDSSGWQHDGTNAVTGSRPVMTNSVINGYAAVAFTDATDSQFAFGPNDGKDFCRNRDGITVHLVLRMRTLVDSTVFSCASAAALRTELRQVNSGQFFLVGRAPDAQAEQNAGASALYQFVQSQFAVYTIVVRYTNATLNMFVNGVPSLSDNTFAGPSKTTDSAENVILGYTGDGFVGDVAEMICYTNAQSDADVVLTAQYLEDKFNTSPILSKYDINGLALNDGDAISGVPDTGPGAYNLGMTNAASRPYWSNSVSVINNNGFAVFDGNNDALTNLSTTVYPQPTHMFLVSRSEGDLATYGVLIAGRASGQALYENITDGKYYLQAGTNLIGIKETNSWVVWEALLNGGSSYARTNNVLMMSGSAGTNTYSGVFLGNDSTLTDGFKGQIAYVEVYSNVLNSFLASRIVTNLANRFGITVYGRN